VSTCAVRTEPAGIDTAEQARTLTVAALGTFLALVAFTLPLTTLTTQAAALDAGPEARASTDNVMLFCVLMAGRRPTRRTRTPPPRVIREIRQRRGSASAHHAKVVLSGVLGLAVRHDAIDANPVRELTPARKSKSTREKTALTEDGLCRLRQHLADSDDAAKYDLRDLVDVLSGLGCRIEELLALDWTRVDDVAGTIAIEGTVIRVPGEGLIVQSHTKSRASMRTITPPAWVLELLVKRHADSHGPWVFPSTAGTLRDPDNTRKQLRQVVAGTESEGLHRTPSGTWLRLDSTPRGCPRGRSPTTWGTSASR
jgi:integrase